jgi:hypothetical protein
MYTEILTGHDLTVEQWESGIFNDYIGELWWKNMMGSKINAVIQVKDDLTKKPGDAITIGVRGLMQGGHVTGNNKGIGNEGKVDFYGQRITIDNDRQVVKVEDIPMAQKRTSFDVLTQAREALVEKNSIQLDEDITTTLSGTSSGRQRGRYLYGALDSNWNATHATALTAVDNSADQLTTAMIDIAKRKALIPGTGVDGVRMRPMRMKNGKNFEQWFTFVGHTLCIRDLVNNDAAWRNAQLNIPPQSNMMSPIYTGSSFKGSWNGTLIYDYERINLISSTIQCAHNFLLGAQAAAVVWGQRSKFGEEESDLGHDISYETHEIRGLSKLYFTRTNEADQGIVHVFAAAVSD